MKVLEQGEFVESQYPAYVRRSRFCMPHLRKLVVSVWSKLSLFWHWAWNRHAFSGVPSDTAEWFEQVQLLDLVRCVLLCSWVYQGKSARKQGDVLHGYGNQQKSAMMVKALCETSETHAELSTSSTRLNCKALKFLFLFRTQNSVFMLLPSPMLDKFLPL